MRFDDAADFDAFRRGVGERLLTVDILAGFEGIEDHRLVPMVGSGDGDAIYGGIGEQVVIIRVNFSSAVGA
jgi:hypothetical protein